MLYIVTVDGCLRTLRCCLLIISRDASSQLIYTGRRLCLLLIQPFGPILYFRKGCIDVIILCICRIELVILFLYGSLRSVKADKPQGYLQPPLFSLIFKECLCLFRLL